MFSAAKRIAVSAVLFTLFALEAAGVGNAVFERVHIKVSLIEPAEVRYNASLPLNMGRRQPENRWVMIAVEYTPKAKNVTYGKRRDKSDAFQRHQQSWLDHVDLRLRVIFDSIGSDGKQEKVMLDGITSFWTVKLDDTKHVAVMFIPAYLIDRHYVQIPRSSKTQRGRKANVSGFVARKIKESDLVVEAVFTADGEELASAYCNAGVSNLVKAKNNFERMVGQVPGHLYFKGAVLSKGKSPWAFYNINHFDPEKTAGQTK